MARLLGCDGPVFIEFPNHDPCLDHANCFGIGLAESIFACCLIAFALKIKRRRESIWITWCVAEKYMPAISVFPRLRVHSKTVSGKLKWPVLLSNCGMEFPCILEGIGFCCVQGKTWSDLLNASIHREYKLALPLSPDSDGTGINNANRFEFDHFTLLMFVRAILARRCMRQREAKVVGRRHCACT